MVKKTKQIINKIQFLMDKFKIKFKNNMRKIVKQKIMKRENND